MKSLILSFLILSTSQAEICQEDAPFDPKRHYGKVHDLDQEMRQIFRRSSLTDRGQEITPVEQNYWSLKDRIKLLRDKITRK